MGTKRYHEIVCDRDGCKKVAKVQLTESTFHGETDDNTPMPTGWAYVRWTKGSVKMSHHMRAVDRSWDGARWFCPECMKEIEKVMRTKDATLFD